MTIPALATADKLFICSYSIGTNIDHRKALGIINEITTFTSEYIDGFCWIPVVSPQETNDHSWWWDVPDKDQVFIKVGVRISADGYFHAWLISTQSVSELIQWNNKYDETNQPTDDTTTLHWCIEKMYQVIYGNTTSFVVANIKFQNYVSGATRLYLFGNYSNSWTNPVSYTIDHPTNVKKSSVSWYPNNTTVILGDYIFSILNSPAHKCATDTLPSTLTNTTFTKAFLDDGGVFTDYTTESNDNLPNNVKLMPTVSATGDMFYFGYSYRYYEIRLNIGTAAVSSGSNISWEYWNGTAWVSLAATDGTNHFTNSGTNTVVLNMTASDLLLWSTTVINGSTLYWIRAKLTGSAFTTSPLLTQGWIRAPDEWFDFGIKPFEDDPSDPEPLFWLKVDNVSSSTSIASLCNPTDPALKTFEDCHIIASSSVATGNNSGRTYNLVDPGSGTNCSTYSSCSNLVSEKYLVLNQENNRAYVWVPGACSDPTYGNQTDCENAGHTWTPGHYICDTSFTYDTIVTYTISQWQSITPADIDYVQTKAQFLDRLIGDAILALYYEVTTSDTFVEALGDLDELKHFNFTVTDVGSVTNAYRTIFTKHVGIGLLTSAAPTVNTKDWIISWGVNDYFSNWQTPDGLAARTPAVTNTPYVHPFTHHDEFSIVSGEPVLGGFLYTLATSSGFLSRDPGTVSIIPYPVSNLGEFDHLYALLTSNAFLSRDPGTESMIPHPVSNLGEFDFLVALITSPGFLSRDPGSDTMIPYPVGHDADFCHLYLFVKPPFSVLYHLKTAGDDLKDGLSWANAWKTWAHAMQNTPNERTLLVMHGTYSGELQANPDNSIVIFLVDLSGNDAPSTATVTLA